MDQSKLDAIKQYVETAKGPGVMQKESEDVTDRLGTALLMLCDVLGEDEDVATAPEPDLNEIVFMISFPPCPLTASQIWPDGDGPANPTAEDVLDEMQQHDSTPWMVALGWSLFDDSPMTIEGDESKAQWIA